MCINTLMPFITLVLHKSQKWHINLKLIVVYMYTCENKQTNLLLKKKKHLLFTKNTQCFIFAKGQDDWS